MSYTYTRSIINGDKQLHGMQWLKKRRSTLQRRKSDFIDSKDASWPQITLVILVLIAVSSLPVLVFVLDRQDDGENDSTTDVNGQWGCGQEQAWLHTQCTPTVYSLISLSVCSSYLPWLKQIQHDTNDANASAVTISVSSSGEMCSFKRKEDELAFLIRLTTLSSTKCQSHAVSFLCNYFYRPCASTKYWPTKDECLAVKEDHCSSEWTFLEEQLNAGDYCLGIPNCNTLPLSQQKMKTAIQTTLLPNSSSTSGSTVTCSTTSFRDIKTIRKSIKHSFNTTAEIALPRLNIATSINLKSSNSTIRPFNYSQNLPDSNLPSPSPVFLTQPSGNRSTLPCKPPFLPSTSHHGRCSPPCPAEKWLVSKEGFIAIRAVLYLTVGLVGTCSIIIFYTWARTKSLRVFPHTVTLFMAISYFIASLY
jgi:hypothetical protein